MKLNRITSMAILASALLVSVYSCKQKPQREVESEPVVEAPCSVQQPEWAANAVIYEVNIRQYTKEGTFAAFEQHLPRLKELGVDVLWIMPMYPISQKNRKGELGSYYAIADYKAVNPEFGYNADFKQLVNKAHELGFKVIIDWVANHTGCDNVWLSDHPEYFVKDSLNNFVSPHDWTDTYKLDYTNKEMRAAMVDAMKYWVQEFNIDGFRCDVAGEVPTDFWNDARKELESIKPLFMLAEAEKPDLMNHAFNMDYSWELMHLMNSVAKGEKNANDVYRYIQQLDTLACTNAYKMNFITNHDENSWNGTEYERYKKGANTFAVLTYTLNGMPLIYSGQEVGLKKRLEFFKKDPIPSWEANDVTTFYKQLNNLKHTHPALSTGENGAPIERISTSADENVLILSRQKGDDRIVTMLNLSPRATSYTINKYVSSDQFVDYFTGDTISQLPSILAGWEYKVLIK